MRWRSRRRRRPHGQRAGHGGAERRQGQHGGQERFAFENDFLLKHLRRVLNENWRRLPEPIATATEIEIEVRWSEKAGAKRVVTDQPSELIVGGQSWPCPTTPACRSCCTARRSIASGERCGDCRFRGAPGAAAEPAPPPTDRGRCGGGGDADALRRRRLGARAIGAVSQPPSQSCEQPGPPNR